MIEEIRFDEITEYSAAPDADRFRPTTLDELNVISDEIDRSQESSLQTEWSRHAWEVDREACDKALEALSMGKTVLVARDEDGYYFAVTRAEVKA